MYISYKIRRQYQNSSLFLGTYQSTHTTCTTLPTTRSLVTSSTRFTRPTRSSRELAKPLSCWTTNSMVCSRDTTELDEMIAAPSGTTSGFVSAQLKAPAICSMNMQARGPMRWKSYKISWWQVRMSSTHLEVQTAQTVMTLTAKLVLSTSTQTKELFSELSHPPKRVNHETYLLLIFHLCLCLPFLSANYVNSRMGLFICLFIVLFFKLCFSSKRNTCFYFPK